MATSFIKDLLELVTFIDNANKSIAFSSFEGKLRDYITGKINNVDLSDLTNDNIEATIQNITKEFTNNYINTVPSLYRTEATVLSGKTIADAVRKKRDALASNPLAQIDVTMGNSIEENLKGYINGDFSAWDSMENIMGTADSVRALNLPTRLNKQGNLVTKDDIANTLRDAGISSFAKAAFLASNDPFEKNNIQTIALEMISPQAGENLLKELAPLSSDKVNIQDFEEQLNKIISGKDPAKEFLKRSPILSLSYQLNQTTKKMLPEDIEEYLQEINQTLDRDFGIKATNLEELDQQTKKLFEERAGSFNADDLAQDYITAMFLQQKLAYFKGRLLQDSATAMAEQGFFSKDNIDFIDTGEKIKAFNRADEVLKTLQAKNLPTTTLLPQHYYNDYITYLKLLNPRQLDGEFELLKGSIGDKSLSVMIKQMSEKDPTYALILNLKNFFPEIGATEVADIFTAELTGSSKGRNIIKDETIRLTFLNNPAMAKSMSDFHHNASLQSKRPDLSNIASKLYSSIDKSNLVLLPSINGKPIEKILRELEPKDFSTLNINNTTNNTDLYWDGIKNNPFLKQHVRNLLLENTGNGTFYIKYGKGLEYLTDESGTKVEIGTRRLSILDQLPKSLR